MGWGGEASKLPTFPDDVKTTHMIKMIHMRKRDNNDKNVLNMIKMINKKNDTNDKNDFYKKKIQNINPIKMIIMTNN